MEDVDKEMAGKFNERVALLRSYLVLAENPADLADDNHRRIIFAKLSYGLRKCGEYLSWARFHERMATIDLKKSESIAMIDGIYDFIKAEKDKGRDGKVTEKVRESYKFLDKDVGAALTREALLEAMVEQLQTMKSEFVMAIATLKAMAYGMKDQDFMSSASVAVDERK
jgi:hypothetical protein